MAAFLCPEDFLFVLIIRGALKHIEHELRQDFCFIPEILLPAKERLKSIVGDQLAISLHVRRGDYVGKPHHPTQSLEYYLNALEHFDNNLPVIIVSGDPYWCKEQKIFLDDRFFISMNGNAANDLCMMSLCNNHVIANSSFSWW